MNLVNYEPMSYLNQLHREMNRLFSRDLFSDEESTVATSNWAPAIDIKEEDKQFLIKADIPGVDAKDIEVTMENGVLSIKGERSDEKKEENNGYRRVERSHGAFYRRFTLPDTADGEHISAKSNNGVLQIMISKQEVAQPKRISVKVK